MMTIPKSPTDTLAEASEPKTYPLVFDSKNRYWETSPEYVMLFLKSQENWMNDRLHARGYVFLNDVYDALGFPRTPAGQIVGWISDGGIGIINFGLPVATKNAPIAPQPFESITLTLNPDGVIYNLI